MGSDDTAGAADTATPASETSTSCVGVDKDVVLSDPVGDADPAYIDLTELTVRVTDDEVIAELTLADLSGPFPFGFRDPWFAEHD